ncbi:MAG: hypothetical protein ACLSCW_06615 [Gemmiger formicilis]
MCGGSGPTTCRDLSRVPWPSKREGDCTSEDYLLMRLRLVSGLNIPAYERRGGRFTAAQRVFMRQCVGHGYAVWDGEVFRLTPAGMVVQNAILEELM